MTPIKSQSNKENMCLSSSKKASSVKRRSKAVLQPRNQSVLVGIDGKLALNSPNSTKRKTFECKTEQATKQLFLDMTTNQPKKRKIVDDPSSSAIEESPISAPPSKKQRTFATCSVQTYDGEPVKIIIPRTYKASISTEVKHTPSNMLTSDVAPSRYWEMMAEKRREALEISMKKDELLYTENAKLKDGVKVLEQENCLLEDHVKEVKALSEMVQGLVSEDDGLLFKEE